MTISMEILTRTETGITVHFDYLLLKYIADAISEIGLQICALIIYLTNEPFKAYTENMVLTLHGGTADFSIRLN